MSLNVAKLEKVRELAGGIVQARCPACAEGGNDRAGEHLRIYPGGRFGCCVHPKDGQHRKRIWALAGCKLHRSPSESFSLRLKVLAHGHHSALPAAQSVKAALTKFSPQPSSDLRPPSPAPASEGLGTLGTLKTESVATAKKVSQTSQAATSNPMSLQSEYFGTLGTPFFNPRAYAREDSPNIDTPVYMCKDIENTVPSVPTPCGGPPLPTGTGKKLPFLTAGGDLSIPFDSPERYHWWRGGQSVAATLAEVRDRMSAAQKEENHAVTV